MTLHLRNCCHLFTGIPHRLTFCRTVTAVARGSEELRINRSRSSTRHWSLPENIAARMRQDILLNPSFQGRIVITKKTWEAASTSSLSVLDRLKTTDSLNVDQSGRQALASLNATEIQQLLTDMVNMPQSRRSADLMKVVEGVCCSKASSFDNASMLFMADAFLSMQYQCSSFVTTIFAEFDRRWTDAAGVSKEDVLQLAFFVCLARKCPLNLMLKIEKFVNKYTELFTGNELGLICHAFFATNTSFRDYATLERVSDVTLRDLSDKHLKPYMLGNVLKALRHAHFVKLSFYDELGRSISSSSFGKVRLSLNDLVNITSAYSSLKISHSELFSFIASQVVRLIERPSGSRGPRTKDLARLVSSFASLREPLADVVHKTLIGGLEEDVGLAHMYPEMFVEALLALAMNKVYPSNLLRVLFSPEYVSRKSARPLEQTFQLLLLDSAVKIESRDFSHSNNTWSQEPLGSLKFDACTRQGLRSLINCLHQILPQPSCVECHYILRHSRITDVEIRVDGSGRPLPFNTAATDISTLRSIPETELRVPVARSDGSVARTSITEELLEQAAASSAASSIDPGITHILPIEKRFGSERRIVMKVMGWNQYTLNKSLLLGIHDMELRLLRQLGYEILVIGPVQAKQLDSMSASGRTEFVSNLLANTLNIKLTGK